MGNDYYNGGAGADLIDLGGLIDGVTVDLAAGTASGSAIGQNRISGFENVSGGAGGDTLTGDAGGNLLQGNGGNDTLTGGLGPDRLEGGSGGDHLHGGIGADTLDGGAGADVMNGGEDDDTYYVDDAGDRVIEAAAGGRDRIFTSVSYSIASSHVEELRVHDLMSHAAFTLTGNNLDNLIWSGDGDDVIDGRGGADTLWGGDGNDTYYVDEAGDEVREFSGNGIDTVYAAVSYTLADEVENLVAAGTAAIHLTGNDLDNAITGNAGANVLSGAGGADRLDGRAGADWMEGGSGDDSYYVDEADDRVIETAGGGVDIVYTSVSYSVSDASVEILLASGSAAINLTGNHLSNRISGNAGANVLVGGAGADTLNGGTGADRMEGGADNDTYYVDNAGDQVIEIAGGGVDTVYTTISHVLAADVENLVASREAAISLTGNALDNRITGNAGANTISGGDGSDILLGGLGRDTFVFKDAALSSLDRILDFRVADDMIWLDNAVFTKLGASGTETAPVMLNEEFFIVGDRAKDADDHLIYNQANGCLYYDADGSGGGEQIAFATLTAGLALAHSKFFVM